MDPVEGLAGKGVHVPAFVEIVVGKVFDAVLLGDLAGTCAEVFESDVRIDLGDGPRTEEYSRQESDRSGLYATGHARAEDEYQCGDPG